MRGTSLAERKTHSPSGQRVRHSGELEESDVGAAGRGAVDGPAVGKMIGGAGGAAFVVAAHHEVCLFCLRGGRQPWSDC